MVAVIVGVDLVFFRLATNIGIVLLFGAVYPAGDGAQERP
jgi:hypothetical protein